MGLHIGMKMKIKDKGRVKVAKILEVDGNDVKIKVGKKSYWVRMELLSEKYEVKKW